MAVVTITISTSTNGISWSPKNPVATTADTVRFGCADGPWMMEFKKDKSPLTKTKLNGAKGPNGRKGSKVKVKVKKKTRYWYSVAVWDAKNGRVWLVDPPLDIVPGG
jgi:hypothetical protein